MVTLLSLAIRQDKFYQTVTHLCNIQTWCCNLWTFYRYWVLCFKHYKICVGYFESTEQPISCMDNTNASSGKKWNKMLLKHTTPLSVRIGCGSHKHDLCWKHIGKYQNICYKNASLLTIWKAFHYCPLAIPSRGHKCLWRSFCNSILPMCYETGSA